MGGDCRWEQPRRKGKTSTGGRVDKEKNEKMDPFEFIEEKGLFELRPQGLGSQHRGITGKSRLTLDHLSGQSK